MPESTPSRLSGSTPASPPGPVATTGTLAVPGAVLHYQTCGTGPILLIAQSGEGDADRSADLAVQLADTYTVVTYDRRGLSRSHPDASGQTAPLSQHADDVHRLLASLAKEPVAVLGCSIGAVIGMHAAVRHPEQIHTLIAHEPVAPRLLTPPERIRHERELRALQDIYRREGLGAALPEIARVLGIDPTGGDAEPGLTPQPINARRIANFDYFIRHDFSAVIDDSLDFAALRSVGTRVVPAAGRTTPSAVFDRRCATELAALLGTDVQLLPGGHNGNTSHPRGYAERIRQIVREAV